MLGGGWWRRFQCVMKHLVNHVPVAQSASHLPLKSCLRDLGIGFDLGLPHLHPAEGELSCWGYTLIPECQMQWRLLHSFPLCRETIGKVLYYLKEWIQQHLPTIMDHPEVPPGSTTPHLIFHNQTTVIFSVFEGLFLFTSGIPNNSICKCAYMSLQSITDVSLFSYISYIQCHVG